MPVINILPPHVADLIAAGEVVERPASVVKELVENAIDAGARSVTVDIRGGGMKLIRVVDDGCGMTPEDAGIAFLRHATSKIADEHGLESISTLGFRGEALAAISSVSRIELETRPAGADAGCRVVLSGGEIDEMGPCGCPDGTSMSVRELFYNTPARLKFMKSDKSEGSACVQMALRCALGHPEVSVRVYKDGEEEFFSPGDGEIRSALYALLGREQAANMVEVSGESGGVRVRGFITVPHAGRGNRAMQFFFLNGRCFKSLSLQTALERAYQNTLLTGRFPGCALYVELSPGKVDVNVHPTKQEVKFSDEKSVFDAVYYACLAAIGRERQTAEISLNAPDGRRHAASGAVQETKAQPRDDFYRSMRADEFREQLRGSGSDGSISAARVRVIAPAADYTQQRLDLPPAVPVTLLQQSDAYGTAPAPGQAADPANASADVHGPSARTQTAPGTDGLFDAPVPPLAPPSGTTAWAEARRVRPIPQEEHSAHAAGEAPAPDASGAGAYPAVSAPQNTVRTVSAGTGEPGPDADVPASDGGTGAQVPEFRVIGEAMNTYIIVESGDALWLIDKHAAHERMNFDRLMAARSPVMSQALLAPVTWSPGEDTVELLEHSRDLLTEAGFEIESYGSGSVIIRAVPADTEGEETAMLEEICDKLRTGSGVNEARDAIYHTIACKAAIKAGWQTDDRERAVIAAQVLSGAVRYCPHGRPVSVRLTHRELDKQFKRIV